MHPLGPLLDPLLVHRLAGLGIGGRRVTVGAAGGAHRSPLKGASVEFRQRRPYAPGDEPRHIDWRVLARTDRAFVREFEDETDLRATLLLDASGSMAYGEPASKFDYAARLAAALAFVLLSAAMPSRLLSAFPTGVPIARVTLDEALVRVTQRLSTAARLGHGALAAAGA